MKRWIFWLGVIISLVLLYFAFRNQEFNLVWAVIKEANYIWLLPGVAIYFVAVWARAWRWHYLLRPLKTIQTKKMFPIVTIGYMGNNIYPYRAGEVLRAYILRKREDIPMSASLATIVVERVFDGVVMLGFIFMNLPELARLTGDSGFIGNIQTLALWGAGIFLIVLMIFLLAAMFPSRIQIFTTWMINRVIPTKLRGKITNLTARFLEGLEALRSPREVCLLYTSPSPRDRTRSRMPSSA
mgnify:CR=1 FL=1